MSSGSQLAGLESRLNSIDRKLSILVKGNKPANINEFISPHTIIILIVIAIITAIWSIILIKKWELEEKNYHITILLSIIAIVIIYLMARHINSD